MSCRSVILPRGSSRHSSRYWPTGSSAEPILPSAMAMPTKSPMSDLCMDWDWVNRSRCQWGAYHSSWMTPLWITISAWEPYSAAKRSMSARAAALTVRCSGAATGST